MMLEAKGFYVQDFAYHCLYLVEGVASHHYKQKHINMGSVISKINTKN
jgi:hypothetical protein